MITNEALTSYVVNSNIFCKIFIEKCHCDVIINPYFSIILIGGYVMDPMIKLGIIGDYDGRPTHLATEEAVKHCASRLGFIAEWDWIPTDSLEHGVADQLSHYDGLWCAPGSPYKSMNG